MSVIYIAGVKTAGCLLRDANIKFLYQLQRQINLRLHCAIHTVQSKGKGVHEPEEEVGSCVRSIITKCISEPRSEQ